ncbi:hypothetical protein SDC9_129946 [bioreactor metagenome]|uniref:Uncharacterized protein n=1 Tax=bioreactor metagenome TaxID=1076179 RepID=A0A645D0Y8_9ZZZZ
MVRCQADEVIACRAQIFHSAFDIQNHLRVCRARRIGGRERVAAVIGARIHPDGCAGHGAFDV